MNFLIETIRVMFTHGLVYLACGLVMASVIAWGASRCALLRFRLPVLMVAILVLWVSMFVAADFGYREWQQIPNPPQEAFSDAGPFVFLFLGWLPGSIISVAMLWLCRRFFPLRPSSGGFGSAGNAVLPRV